MTLQLRFLTVITATFALIVMTVFPPIVAASFASTSLSYNFNTPGMLAANFNSYASSGSITEVASGGLNNTGAINVPSGSGGVFTTKTSYSMGPVGSVYEFNSYMYIDGGNGYGGMGFTTTPIPTALNTNNSNGPLAPNDALSISVHGGGFVFLNGATAYTGLWSSDTNGGGVTTDHKSTTVQLLNSNLWWKVFFKVTRRSATTFDMQVDVRPTDATGAVIAAGDYAVVSVNGVTSTALANAASINTFFNFSGDRVRYFDDYSVNLQGGSSVIAENAPVVLTVGAADSSNVVTVDGNVTAQGSSPVTARGFVYGTTASPTLSDGVLPAGSGTGTYQSTTSTLPGGTYFFRAYATNASGTTYGSENQLTLAAISSPSPSPSVSLTSSSGNELALTGVTPESFTMNLMLGLLAVSLGSGLVVMRTRRRTVVNRAHRNAFLSDNSEQSLK